MLQIVFWDVQHGSAAYIKTPEKKHIVVDLGTGSVKENKNFSPLLHLKTKYNISQLDEVIITHPHTDHIDDIFYFDDLSPKILRRPKHLKEGDTRNDNPDKDKDVEKINKYFEINNRFNTKVKSPNNPELPNNNGGVKFSFFTPTKSSKSNLNNHSIVCILEYLGVKILIPGDNEPPSWKELLEENDFKDAIKGIDLFVASHHGRESGYCSELFNYFKPELVIASDGPETDTSCVDKYKNIAKGYSVQKRNGGSEKRYCLTTRKDGVINVKIYKEDEELYQIVTID